MGYMERIISIYTQKQLIHRISKQTNKISNNVIEIAFANAIESQQRTMFNVQCTEQWAESVYNIASWWTSHFGKSLFDFEPFAHIVSFMLQCRLPFGTSSYSLTMSGSCCRTRTFLNFFATEAKKRVSANDGSPPRHIIHYKI